MWQFLRPSSSRQGGCGAETQYLQICIASCNRYTFIRFLKVLRRKYGKVLLFVDNASYHRAALVREQLAEWNGDVVLRFLPPYTPELNRIEGQWRGFKKATANRLYRTIGELQKSIRVMLRRGEIRICQMSDCLI